MEMKAYTLDSPPTYVHFLIYIIYIYLILAEKNCVTIFVGHPVYVTVQLSYQVHISFKKNYFISIRRQ